MSISTKERPPFGPALDGGIVGEAQVGLQHAGAQPLELLVGLRLLDLLLGHGGVAHPVGAVHLGGDLPDLGLQGLRWVEFFPVDDRQRRPTLKGHGPGRKMQRARSTT